MAEPWGSWQVVHPCSTGRCRALALAADATTSLWQLAHISLPGLRRLPLAPEACGSWQPMHLPSTTGLWVLRAWAGTTS